MRGKLVSKGMILAIIMLLASVVPHACGNNQKIKDEGVARIFYQDIVHVNDDYNETTLTWNVIHFDNITNGINAVNKSGTVFVHNGTYYENLFIDKELTLMGEDEDEWGNDTYGPVITGDGIEDVIRITADEVNISGFTVNNGISGICLQSNLCNISRNNINQNDKGINLLGASDTFIGHNNITDNEIGISSDAEENNKNIIIYKNNITSNHQDGIAAALYNCNINYNTIIDNIYIGIFIKKGNDNIIISNYLKNPDSEVGIAIDQGENNQISGNYIYFNRYGIVLDINCYGNKVNGNDIADNDWGIFLRDSRLNTITKNNFKRSSIQHAIFKDSYLNLFLLNYWDKSPPLLPRRIWGYRSTFPLIWLTFDWLPWIKEWDI